MSTFLINITIIAGSSVTPLITSHDGPMMHRPARTHERTTNLLPARLTDTRKEIIYIYMSLNGFYVQSRPSPSTNAPILLLILILMRLMMMLVIWDTLAVPSS